MKINMLSRSTFAVFLILILIFGVVDTLMATPYYQETSADNSSTIVRIQERGYMIVGVKYDAPPFGFRDENGDLVGFEIDLVKEFAQRWLEDVNAIEFVQVTSGNRIEQLLAGDIDLIAATMTYTEERDEQIDFSQTYFLDGQNILVRLDSGIADIEGLNGKKVAAVKGSTSLDQMVAYAAANNIEVEIVEFEKYTEAVNPLLDKDVDALTTDKGILLGLAKEHPELGVLLDNNFSEEPYGLGIKPGDVEFATLINSTLQEMGKDGTYNQIYKKWFPSEEPYTMEVIQDDLPEPTAQADSQNITTTSGVSNTISEFQQTITESMPVTLSTTISVTDSQPTAIAVIDKLPDTGTSLRAFSLQIFLAPLVCIGMLIIVELFNRRRSKK